MVDKKPAAPARKWKAADTTAAVDALMEKLEHPHVDAIAALRKIITSTDRSIEEGVKWNAPSFRTTEYFATVHLRSRTGAALILHLGAKARKGPTPKVDDPAELLEWLAKDRALVHFEDLADVRAKKKPLQTLLRQWLAFV